MSKYTVTFFIYFFILLSSAVFIVFPKEKAYGQGPYACEGMCEPNSCASMGYASGTGACNISYLPYCCLNATPTPTVTPIPQDECTREGGHCAFVACAYPWKGDSTACTPDYFVCCKPSCPDTCQTGIGGNSCMDGYIPSGAGFCNAGQTCCKLDTYCPGGKCTSGSCESGYHDNGTKCQDNTTCCALDNNNIIKCGSVKNCGGVCGSVQCPADEKCVEYQNCHEKSGFKDSCSLAAIEDCTFAGYQCVSFPGSCSSGCVASRCVGNVCDSHTAGCPAALDGTRAAGCGDVDDCGGYDCQNCLPGGGGPTSTPPPTNTPTTAPMQTLRMIAKKVNSGSPTCDQVASSPALDGTSFLVTGVNQTQSGGNFVTYSVLSGQQYSVGVLTPVNWAAQFVCWTDDTVAPYTWKPQRGLTSPQVSGSSPLTGYVAAALGGSWTQTGGAGDVHAKTSLTSLVPATTPVSYFSADGLGGYPGVVSYESGVPDFSLDINTNGDEADSNTLSSTRWLANSSHTPIQFYEHFTTILGGMVAEDTWNKVAGTIAKADLDACPNQWCYFVPGAGTSDTATITNPLTIGANEKRIIVINGNLAINAQVRVTNGGFLAFIVKGDITVDPSVGGSPVVYSAGVTPQVEGIYITDGTFTIPHGSGATDPQLVVKGMVIANNMSIARKLSDADNVQYPATMFVYNPNYLFSMPILMQEVPFLWREIEP